jgi:hypothetical protein
MLPKNKIKKSSNRLHIILIFKVSKYIKVSNTFYHSNNNFKNNILKIISSTTPKVLEMSSRNLFEVIIDRLPKAWMCNTLNL